LPDFSILAKFSHYEWSSFPGADQPIRALTSQKL
jgi:hypothetical protein